MVERRYAHEWLARVAAALLASVVGLGATEAASETARDDRTRRTAPAPAAQPASEAGLPGPDAWRDPARWQRLRLYMSRFDVLRILGEPGKVTRYYAFERWEYPDALGRRVNFDERGRLIAWGPYAR